MKIKVNKEFKKMFNIYIGPYHKYIRRWINSLDYETAMILHEEYRQKNNGMPIE